LPLQNAEIWWIIALGTIVTVSFAIFLISTIAVNQRRFIRIQEEKLEAVKKSEAKYSDLFNNVTDVVFIHSLEGRILEINASGLALLNIGAEDIVGKLLKDIFDPMYSRRIDDYLMEIRLRGEATGFFSLTCRDGRCMTFEYRNSLIKKNETSIAIRGIARDITGQRSSAKLVRASESRFRHLVRFSPLPMVIHSGRIIKYANEAVVNLMKARDLSEIIGKSIDDFIVYVSPDTLESRERRDEKNPTILIEKLRGLNNQLIDVETASLPVSFYGEPAVHTVIRDITRSKQIEAKLREIPKQIIDAQEAERGRVARDLHDGVNQILGSVKFRLQATETAALPVAKNVAEDIEQIYHDLEKAIIEIKRISHNLRPSILDDLGLLAAVRNMCDDFQKRTKIIVDYTFDQLPERLPAEIELAFFRIIQEALNNIEKHSKATQVTVGITAEEEEIQTSIIDNGKGFSPETLRASNGDRKGLGMDTMKERAAFIGGCTTIHSGPYKGTRIIVRIPIKAKVVSR
jgi:PAS domain S-box-containing protein